MLVYIIYQHFLASLLRTGLYFSDSSLCYLLAFFNICASQGSSPLQCQFILFTSTFFSIHTSQGPSRLQCQLILFTSTFFSINASQEPSLLQCQLILFTSIFQHLYFQASFPSPMLVYIIYQHFLASLLPMDLYFCDANSYYLLAFFSISAS